MSDSPARPQGTPIPIPPDFPVTWDDPEDEKLTWGHDPMHNPDPRTMLEIDYARTNSGFNRAFAEYGMPVRSQGRYFNQYAYGAMIPAVPPEQMEAQGKIAEKNIGAAMARLDELWENEWLPEIKQLLAAWDAFDLPGADIPALLAHLDETIENDSRMWHLHFLIVLPAHLPISLFQEMHDDLFEDGSAFGAFTLLAGLGNKTVETGHQLWSLSRQALDIPAVKQILREQPTDKVLATLEATPEAGAFVTAIHEYLAEYGQRGMMWGITSPSWIEDPTPVIKNLKDYVTGSQRDPVAELAQLVAQREQAVAAARERMADFPKPVRTQFESLLKTAQTGTIISEDHGFWIDFAGTYRVRQVFMEFARRFAAAAVIAAPDDIFHLTLAELREAASNLSTTDYQALVAGRKADLAHYHTLTPPRALGTDYGPPPDSPMARGNAKFFGSAPPPSDDPAVLRGHPGSPGKIQGPARILQSAAEADKLNKGDILVAKTTAPPWTPLFATAAAIVTDTGGILSHCAVVAREYGIPAVVGVGRATQVIQDGQLVEVDGENGIIRLLNND